MRKKIIKKLIESESPEDLKLGMVYLSYYIQKNGLKRLTISDGGMTKNALSITDFAPKLDGWYLIDNKIKKFSINVGITDKSSYIVYSCNKRYRDIIKMFKQEVIHEDI